MGMGQGIGLVGKLEGRSSGRVTGGISRCQVECCFSSKLVGWEKLGTRICTEIRGLVILSRNIELDSDSKGGF